MNNLTAEEIEELDCNLARYDEAGIPLKGRSRMLFKIGRKFNPHPASKEVINDYIDARNTGRAIKNKLPLLNGE